VAGAIVAGALANKPRNGGEAWVRLSWVLGLARLGFDTCFVEQIESGECVDEEGAGVDFAASLNRSYFESVVGEFGLAGRSSLLCDGGSEAAGLGLEQVVERAADADLLVNISGHLSVERVLKGPRTSLYVDLDPGFTQAWHVDRGVPFSLSAHDRYASVGLNLGSPACPIPDCGIEWIPTLPPVVLERWPRREPPPGPTRFTTVATWRSPYGRLEIGGREMELKHHRFRRLVELPEKVAGAEFEIALDIHPGDAADLEALRAHGWKVVDPVAAAGTPRRFLEYVGASAAEFSVAQGVYADTASGWFSDRSAAYLASGHPALVQDTGLAAVLPPDGGPLAFDGLEDAAAAAERIGAELERQSEAARAFAVRHLDSDVVLGRLLGLLGIGG
jgi:hypothetical protein